MKPQRRFDDLQVGLMVLAALAILIVGSLWIASGGLGGRSGQVYRVRLTDSGGLQSGADVRIAGLRVGRVGASDLDLTHAYPAGYRVRLDPSIELRRDASARVAMPGFFGDPFLAIDPGSTSQPLLEPGDEIRGAGMTDLESRLQKLDAVADQVTELLSRSTALIADLQLTLPTTLERVDALLSEDNARRVESLLADAQQTVNDAAPRLRALLDDLDSVARRADARLESLPVLIERVDGVLLSLQEALGPDGARIVGLLDSTDQTLSDAGESLEWLRANRSELETALSDLTDTMANLKAFSQTLEERPFSLIRIRSEPERVPGGDR